MNVEDYTMNTTSFITYHKKLKRGGSALFTLLHAIMNLEVYTVNMMSVWKSVPVGGAEMPEWVLKISSEKLN